MGDEISKVHFEEHDFAAFKKRMQAEMDQLRAWERQRRFSEDEQFVAGLELEAWLLERDGTPSPDNGQFLESLSREEVVPELAKFNFELNVPPQFVKGNGLERMHHDLMRSWQSCGEMAEKLGRRITCIGILPTLTDELLCVQNMTERSRFAALNRQVFRLRHGEPLHLDIEGIDSLHSQHNDVMLEAAATSLQVHLKVPASRFSRYYNAFIAGSCATVAIAANAPLLFGKRLWHDTRIPAFEQAVDTGHELRRVSFGEGFATDDFLDLFQQKLDGYPVLLPVELEGFPETIPHLRLHNGTLWIWNRPLIGFESNGQPHVRVEHRVMSAGPTGTDMLANVVFAIGLAHMLASEDQITFDSTNFEHCRNNFYAGARYGIDANVYWNGRTYGLSSLLQEQWLPATVDALRDLQVKESLIESMHEVISGRLQRHQTGALWQLRAFERAKGNMHALLELYLEQQATQRPVHEWS